MSEEQGSESAVSRSQFMKEEKVAEEKEAPKKVSRKDFVKGAAAVAGAGALASCAPAATPAPGETAAPAPTCPPAGECPPAPWLPEKWDYEADVVVVGYGAAGSAAAIAAQDAGAEVIVLEKDPLPRGGNCGCSGGSFGQGGPYNSIEGAIEKARAGFWGTVTDEEQIRAYSENMHENSDWLVSLGMPNPIWSEDPKGRYPLLPGNDSKTSRVNNFDVDGKTNAGYHLFAFMHGCVTDRGINVMLGTPGKELIQDGVTKEILGVKAITGATFTDDWKYTGGEEIYIKAKKGVIVCTGGWANNEEIRQNFSHTPHSAAPPGGFYTWYGTPYNTGDGIYMGTKVGAKLWRMTKMEIHAAASVAASKELGTGVSVTCYGTKLGERTSSIYVNRDGKRFMNEWYSSGHNRTHKEWNEFEDTYEATEGYDYMDYRNIPMYWVFDDTTMKAGSLRGTYEQWVGVHRLIHPDKDIREQWSEDNEEELAKGWFIKADTIEELGSMIECKDFFGRVVGMDAAGLVETVKKYNEYCAAGEDLDFRRDAESMTPLSTPPFYAMEFCENMSYTHGGPKCNQYQQTLDPDDQPIARLYNCGENGSISGFTNEGAGNGAAFKDGRVAGRHATALEPWDA